MSVSHTLLVHTVIENSAKSQVCFLMGDVQYFYLHPVFLSLIKRELLTIKDERKTKVSAYWNMPDTITLQLMLSGYILSH